ERVGYTVVSGASDWEFAPDDRAIQLEVLAGWAGAASELGDLPQAAIDSWLARRRELVAAARSSMRVGHVDVFATTPRSPLSSHASSTSSPSLWIRIGARTASSTRAIGASETLVRPAPNMIGAITTCSRSRQPAARKRDTVSAPPSIRK